MTPSRIEPVTFRLLAQCLNQMRHRVPPEFLLNISYMDIVDICQQEEIRMLTNRYVSINELHFSSQYIHMNQIFTCTSLTQKVVESKHEFMK